MKLILILTALTVFGSSLAINPADFEVCRHDEVACKQPRGLIHYDANHLTPFERYLFSGRSWVIRPAVDNMETSVTIVFKDFKIKDSIFIATSGKYGTKWQQITKTVGSSFEVIATNVTAVNVYVPPSESGRFQAYYYVGCTVLTLGSDDVTFPSMDQIAGLTSTCWVVKPVQIQNRRRVYLTARDVYLTPGSSIMIEDLHANLVLARVNDTLSYEVFVADTLGSETILIDLICSEKPGACESFGNFFSVSYYTVTGEDVACIETQKQCAFNNPRVPKSACLQQCPMLDQIIDEELKREGDYVSHQKPILKSGVISENEGSSESENEEEKEEKKAEEKKKNKEEEEEEVDSRITTKSPPKKKPKKINSALKKKFRKCLKTEADLRKYCFSKRSCKAYGRCATTCLFVKFVKYCDKLRASLTQKILLG